MDGTENRSPFESARALSALIRGSADQIEAHRELPQALFEALADAGMFLLALPRSIGGIELDLPSYIQVLEEIGTADASTAWIVNQCAIFATYAARMPAEVARAIWIDTPRSAVANTPVANAQAKAVPGGYRVSGRHGFSSGCRHAAWLAARGRVATNSEPEERYFFVPAAQAELLDTWHVRGMRGTGTLDFAVNDVFVPAERTVLQAGAPLRENGPLYQIPRSLLFATGDAAVALGLARSCLGAFRELATAKTPRLMQGALREQSLVQAAVGRAEAHVRSGRAFLTEAVCALWSETASMGSNTQERRAALRLATTHAIQLSVEVVDALYKAAGVSVIYEGNLIQRHFQDIHIISQHMQARLTNYEIVGKHALGLKVDPSRL
jgi:alkylation response protein AidB-like acyl-CoA dehydrogenase